MLVVTGPNTGGKTVVLKTIGLLAIMALSGVPIPAQEGSRVPWLNSIKADIGDEQGISQNLSTFSSHVQRIAGCLHAAEPKALLLLDELGAGTDPEEGGVLGYAVLEQILTSGAMAVVSTHLGRLKGFALKHEEAENGSMAFDGKSLAPLYRLDVGIPGASHALDIAGRVGMPEEVVVRARQLLGKRDTRLEEVIEQVQTARDSARADRARTAELSEQAARDAKQLEVRLTETEARQAWLEEEAGAYVDEEFRIARESLSEPMKELVNAPGEHGKRAKLLRETIDQLWKHTRLHRRRMRFIGALRKDHEIYLPRLQRTAVVRKVDRLRESVTVQYGKMKIDVPFEDVSWLKPLDQ